MTPAQKISEKIGVVLSSGRVEAGALSALATDYADLCRKMNARLDQLREVLDGGDEQQALLMAEVYPPVVEEAETLAFERLEEWKKLCQSNKVTIPPEIRTQVVEKLNDFYARGVSTNHTIYKEYRSAILERNDEMAFTLARTIEKLNPADSNARSERERLERKIFSKRVAVLSVALTAGDETLILQALSSVEVLGLLDRESVSPQVQQAYVIRRHADACAAACKVNGYVEQVAAAQTAGQWMKVRELIARVDSLAVEHRLMLAPEQANILSVGRQYSFEQQAASVKVLQFQDALKVLNLHLDSVETKTQRHGATSILELHSLLADLTRYWQKVEACSMQVEKEIALGVQEQSEALRNEIARRERR